MEPLQVWVFFRLEVTTESGMVGKYWMCKKHPFQYPPTVGLEIDYRTKTGNTVILERVLKDPETGQYQAIQESWISITVGELTLWEAQGWVRQDMPEEEAKK